MNQCLYCSAKNRIFRSLLLHLIHSYVKGRSQAVLDRHLTYDQTFVTLRYPTEYLLGYLIHIVLRFFPWYNIFSKSQTISYPMMSRSDSKKVKFSISNTTTDILLCRLQRFSHLVKRSYVLII